MSKAIIFTGGNAPSSLPASLKENMDFVIAADSGYDTAKKLGFPVALCIGDFDSTKFSKEIQQQQHEQVPCDKDESDTELAIKKVLQLGFTSYVLVGGGGRRLDHLLHTFARFSLYPPPKEWYTGYETLVLVEGSHRFEGLGKDQVVSFLPSSLSSTVVVDAFALKWPLVDYQLSIGTLSLSNRTTKSYLDVRVKHDQTMYVSFPVADELG